MVGRSHRLSHDDAQHSSPLGPLISWSIPIESKLVSEMERVDQNEPPSLVIQVVISEHHGDRVLEYTHNNPIIQSNLELWRCIREYDKANVELPSGFF